VPSPHMGRGWESRLVYTGTRAARTSSSVLSRSVALAHSLSRSRLPFLLPTWSPRGWECVPAGKIMPAWRNFTAPASILCGPTNSVPVTIDLGTNCGRFIRLIICFLTYFLVGIVFFSHNKSANSIFQPAYQHSRMDLCMVLS
jgi:hypothetical protein